MKCFKYSNRPKSYITVTTIDDPYDDGSGKVVSIGCTLKADMQNPTWKVHIPLDLAVSVGQELIRLASLERERSEKAANVSPIRVVQRRDVIETRIDVAPQVEQSAEDVKSASDLAIVQGRVIKRSRKAAD